MSEKFLAAGSVTLLAAGSLLGASSAQAYTDADCGTDLGLDLVALIEGICYVTDMRTGEFVFTAPAGVETLEAILIGGGGGAASDEGTIGYAGGAGEVIFIDELDPAEPIDLYVGRGGAVGQAGEDSILQQGTDIFTADGGEVITSGSGEFGAVSDSDGGLSMNGGGSSGPATATAGGPGYLTSDATLVGANNPLWPEIDGAVEFARGGSVESMREYQQVGDGGYSLLVNGSRENTPGDDGGVIFAYQVPTVGSTSSLPPTGIDASNIGMGAGALVAGGVALGVVAAVRRGRKTH